MIRPSIRARRFLPVVGITVAIVVAGLLRQRSGRSGHAHQETETFSDPFSGSFECDGFTAHFAGQDHGKITTWFDANGDPVRQQGKISAVETDTNDVTLASVVVRTQLNVHIDYGKNIQRLTGIRNLSTEPGRGVRHPERGQPCVIGIRPRPADRRARTGRRHQPGGGFCEALSG
jgi:hypothetical protein